MTPPGLVPGGVSAAAFADLLLAALKAGDAAALLIDPGSDANALAVLQRDLLPRLADRDFALIVKDQPDLVASIGADGIHLSDVTQVKKLRKTFADLSIGVTSPLERHEAMDAAEHGADYIAFDATATDVTLEQILPLIQWWGEMMTVPSVVITDSPDQAKALAAAGADFIAIAPRLWQQPTPLDVIRAFTAAIA
jgi:thiamine-phosphate pyrophosphorylase